MRVEARGRVCTVNLYSDVLCSRDSSCLVDARLAASHVLLHVLVLLLQAQGCSFFTSALALGLLCSHQLVNGRAWALVSSCDNVMATHKISHQPLHA